MVRLNNSRNLLQVGFGVFLAAMGFMQIGQVNAAQLVSTTSKFVEEEIFDNGSSNLTAGREATLWVQAEDFILNKDSLLNKIQFWTVEVPKALWDGTIEYYLFQDVGGKPDKQAFAFGKGVNIQKQTTDRHLFDYYKEFQYSFELENPINLVANQKYWLGLHLSSDLGRDDIFWSASGTGYGIKGMSAYEGNFDNWSRSSEPVERAFRLSGISNIDSKKVPESSMILGSLLMVGVGVAMKRK